MIVNHAIFNKDEMGVYMKPHPEPFYFTTIREPFSLQTSAYNFFTEFTVRQNVTWPMHMEYLRNIQNVTVAPETFFRNPLSLDLGWYEQFEGQTDHDYDNATIDRFLHHLEKKLDLVITLEQFDRGLILLGHYLGVSVNELVSVRMKERKDSHSIPYVHPDPVLNKTLYAINHVDARLYEHFSHLFEEQWERECRQVATLRLQDPDLVLLEDRLTHLQALNAELVQQCSDPDLFAANSCNEAFRTESIPYGRFLAHQKYRRKTTLCADGAFGIAGAGTGASAAVASGSSGSLSSRRRTAVSVTVNTHSSSNTP